ncbi:hypothetical protein V8C26DRAFT_402712 [Trichoderma gracile]
MQKSTYGYTQRLGKLEYPVAEYYGCDAVFTWPRETQKRAKIHPSHCITPRTGYCERFTCNFRMTPCPLRKTQITFLHGLDVPVSCDWQAIAFK